MYEEEVSDFLLFIESRHVCGWLFIYGKVFTATMKPFNCCHIYMGKSKSKKEVKVLSLDKSLGPIQ